MQIMASLPDLWHFATRLALLSAVLFISNASSQNKTYSYQAANLNIFQMDVDIANWQFSKSKN